MNLGLKKKNAIVCASSQGLGKAAALDLAKEGVHLAICSRKLESIERAKEEISSSRSTTAKQNQSSLIFKNPHNKIQP